MWKFNMFLVYSILLAINIVLSKPFFKRSVRAKREGVNSRQLPTVLPMFRPQLPRVPSDPKCAADNLTFCEDIESYPYIHVKYMLERNPAYNDIFSKESREEAKEDLEIRQGSEGTFICRSVTRTVFPKIGKNKNNKWKFIVNQDDFVQGVRVETCRDPDHSCDLIEDIPRDYTTFCRQKYLYTRLLSLNDKGHPAPDIFKLPSACCCAYKRTNYFQKLFDASVLFTPKP